MINAKKYQAVSSLVLLSLSLASCELLGPERHGKLPIYQTVDAEQEDKSVVFEQLDNRPLEEDKDSLKAEIYPGGGLPVSELSTPAERPESKGVGTYSLNFDEADLGEVAKVIISDILEQNYVLSPKVAGSVTLQTTQPLTREQLLPTLEMLLRMNNAALVKDGGVYHIEPAGDALYSSGVSVGRFRGAFPSGYQISVIPVRNVGVDDISEILKPLIDEKTLLHTDASRNLLVVGGSVAELERVKEIIGIFDVDMLRGRSFALFPLAQVDPATLIEELNNIFNNPGKEGESEFFRFIPIERMNAVLVITHQARYLTDIENWITRLDRAKTASGGGVNVYKVQHVDAVTLAATLTDIFSAGGSQSRAPSVAPGRKTLEVTNKQTPAKQTIPRPAQNKLNSGESTGIANVKDVRFIADEGNNSLVIVATAQEYSVIRKVIEQLDVMPLQVLIDATIVDVTLTDELQYGIEWYLSHENGGQNVVNSFNRRASDLASIAAGVATGGLGYGFISNSGDIRAVLRAEANNGNVNVISSPSLMVLNNQEASIQVGNEISLRTSQNTPLTGSISTTSTLVQTNQLQQRKTGVKLKVKPRVNAGGLVIMEITQSVEDPKSSSSAGGNPDILTREITSSVAVQSGETIVLGGLIKENNDNSKTGIPFLHELPLIGPLFGNTHLNKIKTELVVLITPRVVTGKMDARAVSDEFKRKLTGIYQEMPNEAETRRVN